MIDVWIGLSSAEEESVAKSEARSDDYSRTLIYFARTVTRARRQPSKAKGRWFVCCNGLNNPRLSRCRARHCLKRRSNRIAREISPPSAGYPLQYFTICAVPLPQSPQR